MVRRWGIGFDFRSTEPSRNLFSFFDKEKCIVREGQKARKGGLYGEQEGVFVLCFPESTDISRRMLEECLLGVRILRQKDSCQGNVFSFDVPRAMHWLVPMVNTYLAPYLYLAAIY